MTHVQCDSEAVEFLPSLVNDLSLIRPERAREETTAQTEVNEELNQAMESFLRSPGAQESATNQDFVRSASSPPSFQRSGSSDTRGVPDLEEYVRLPEVDALEQTWVGDGTPIRGTKLIREAFAHENPEPSDGSIDITVVCNDEQMREELDSVGEIYGSRDDLPVNVSSKFAVSTGELRDLLAEDHDVFHFIGHIDGTGFQCPDGILDAGTVEETNATTILLNGCRSHDQGVELVKSGASAAVVSLSDLYNSGAVEVGETLARLLHHGFGIGSAMKIIREYTSIGNRYVVVGDPSVVVAQCDTVIPTAHHLNDKEDGFIVVPYTYPSGIHGIGTNFKSHIQGLNSFYIGVEKCGRKRTSLPVLKMSLVGNPRPLIIDNKLVWTDSWLKQLD